MKKSYLAIDMGASSGRHVVANFDGKKVELEELYRFENGPVEMNGSLYWDLPGLWKSVQQGLYAVGAKYGDKITSVGVDTWGVDFAFLGRGGELLGNPYCYRDPRTDGAMARAFQVVPREEIFAQTGLQFMDFNSLYQLMVMKEQNSPLLDVAERLLQIPDLFHWLLSGVESNEYTNATTTQCFNPTTRSWAFSLLKKFGIPTNFLPPTTESGTTLGKLRAKLAQETGLTAANVVLPGTHDTASAVFAVPSRSPLGVPDWAYISLGTWALMGIESPKPVVNDVVSRFNFTNEGGVCGTTRILKNICGMWLLQECRRVWNQQGKKNAAGESLGWEDLNLLTANAKPFVTFIDPDAPEFAKPANMPQLIRDYAARTGQVVPETDGAVLRAIVESLALKFRRVLGMCEEIGGRRIETIHVVGGGVRNKLLLQATADATGRLVVGGPIEGTGVGNALMQAVGAGDIADVVEAREVVRNSFEMTTFEPAENSAPYWDQAYDRFLKIID
ncbi:MAG: rhamnulokinase family protein [Planctomycetia bacterium]|nr:rhamnulokinase family protein [Planctomycetia bacterium]